MNTPAPVENLPDLGMPTSICRYAGVVAYIFDVEFLDGDS